MSHHPRIPNAPIPFNRPSVGHEELASIQSAIESGRISGSGPNTQVCESWLQDRMGAVRALLTHSCSGALEMVGILLDLGAGDEVIMPSYTFVSTANSVALRGATPVFCDIRVDTLNIDETKIEALITARTRAICVVHYAGVSCEMDAILAIADRHDLIVIEDSAQGYLATYKGRPLGTMGQFGTISFHASKNISCGQGGALLMNDPDYIERAQMVLEKGTNQRDFERGSIDHYTWCNTGSSFLLGELAAACLKVQLQRAAALTTDRIAKWKYYHQSLKALSETGRIRRPVVPPQCVHNGHIYHVLIDLTHKRDQVLSALNAKGIEASFHFVPLHTSPFGKQVGQTRGRMNVTTDVAARIIRLPMHHDLSLQQIEYISETLTNIVESY